jgi:chromosome segregation ATPase
MKANETKSRDLREKRLALEHSLEACHDELSQLKRAVGKKDLELKALSLSLDERAAEIAEVRTNLSASIKKEAATQAELQRRTNELADAHATISSLQSKERDAKLELQRSNDATTKVESELRETNQKLDTKTAELTVSRYIIPFTTLVSFIVPFHLSQ